MDETATDYPRGFTPTADSQSPLYRLQLERFEGPLDLLLYLIKKHDIDIFDIPISFITQQYLASLETLSELDIDVAAGFLTLAAELAFIKSKMLVPQPEQADGEEDESLSDPRAELVQRLLEYQKYKDAGEQLSHRDVLGRDSFLRPSLANSDIVETDGAMEEVPIFRLIEALDRLLKKGKLEIKHHVVVENLSVADRLQALIDKLKKDGQFAFSSLFSGPISKRQLILTFLALLEVAKLKLVRIHQAEDEAEIFVRAVPEALNALEANPAGLQGNAEVQDEYR